MLTGRGYFGMTALNEKIYVSGNSYPGCSILEEYSSDTKTWKQIESMNEAWYGNKLINLNDKMYAIGGYKTKTTEKYNSSTKT